MPTISTSLWFDTQGREAAELDEAVSIQVDCADQAEADHHWERLLEGGGQEVRCGRHKDRYGLSWQIVPVRLTELMRDPGPARARRAMEAMTTMVKIDVAELERAADAARPPHSTRVGLGETG